MIFVEVNKTMNQLRQLFLHHNGIVKTNDVIECGIHHSYIKKAIENGMVEKIKQGVYQWVETSQQDDWDVIHYLYSDGVICSLSALHHYRYIDRTPSELHLAFVRTINRKRFKNNSVRIAAHFVSAELLLIGVTNEEFGNQRMQIYSRERLICDVIRQMHQLDREIVNQSIKSYLADPNKNIAMLKPFAKTFRVEKKVDHLIGMWL